MVGSELHGKVAWRGAIDSPKRADTICATARADALIEAVGSRWAPGLRQGGL